MSSVKQNLINRIAEMSIEQVKEISAKVFEMATDESVIVLEFCLDRLEQEMTEQEFVQFCDNL